MEEKKWYIPGFTILREIGRGGSATVFLARRNNSQVVALKIFHTTHDTTLSKRRIMTELNAASSTQSSSIIRVHDLLEVDGHPILVMDYIEGTPLSSFQSRLPYILPEVSVLIIKEILKTLEEVHSRGIIHRDLKPSNIIVDTSGNVFLTDFGLAKLTDASTHTHHGMILGSPDYMSPEQAQGDIATPASDLFSLTSILYYLVTGTKPFSRTSPLAVLAAVIKGEFEPAHRRNPKISPTLSKIIQKGLSLNPKDRFLSAKHFREQLEAYLQSVGLTEENFYFANWFKDPAVETMQTLRTLAEALTREARKAIDLKNWDLATELVSHLSLVAPDSLSLEQLLEELTSSRRKKGGALWLAGSFLIIATGLVFFFTNYKNKKEILPVIPASTESVSMDSASAKSGEKPHVIVPIEANTLKPSPVKKKVPLQQLVQFDIPNDVEIEWEGKKIDPQKPLKVRPGIYSLILRKEGYGAIKREIEVKKDEPTEIRVN